MNRLQTRLVACGVSIVMLLSVGAAGIAAQDATPAADGAAAHPSHIHAGTCAELDPNPAYPLDDVTQIEDGTVATSSTTVDVSIDDLLAEPYAINLHESAENVANYVACGDIAGPVVDGQLVIGLHEQNDSGMAGVAVLTSNADGGTDVTVYSVSDLAS